MSRSVRQDYEGLRETQAQAQEPAAPGPCPAEQSIMQALYEVELAWGSGRFALGRLKGILTSAEKCQGGHQ